MKNLLFTFFASLLLFTTSYAQTTWTVDSLNDAGFGSLRAAANSAVAGDTIRFNPSLIASGSDSIVLTTGEIAFGNKGIIIKGLYNTTDTLCISGNNNSRIFSFIGAGRVILDSLVLKNGNSSSHGGAIYRNNCTDTLIVANSIVSENIAFGSGGGIYSYSSAINTYSKVIVVNSTISENTASTGNGGGVYSSASSSSTTISSASVTVSNTTISGNTATNGGGIYSYSSISSASSSSSYPFLSHSSVTVSNSTISGNTATNGGGIYSYSSSLSASYYSASISSSSVSAANSTISGNTATNGGGIYSYSSSLSSSSSSSISSSSVNVTNSTITGNAATSGGGIYSYTNYFPSSSSSIITITSSIIAQNGSNNSDIYNSQTVIFSNGYNIFSNPITGTIGTDSTNATAAQLNLHALAFNGGSTQTMRPGTGSIAIDNGNPNDTSDAQNTSIVGTRDVGAAESCVIHSFDTIVSCYSYTLVNGITYYSNDTNLVYSLINSMGCDSVIHLNLNILQPSYSIDSVTTCDSYTWIDGNTYYLSNNTAQHVVTNSVGCDSVITLNLTITNSTLETYEVCDSFTWRNGVTYTQSNYAARDTVLVTSGCDSIFILDLTIRNTEYSTDVRTACDSLTWINGMTYYSSIATVIDTLTNQYGCDSIVTLDLTINNTVNVTDSISACYFYQWSNGQFYVMNNNTATQTIMGSNGCDSIVTLNLEIHIGTLGTDTQVVCDSLVWIDGNTYYTNNTTATYNLVGGNSNGCDSIVTLNLIINNNQTTDVISSCNPITWIDGITYSSSNNTTTYITTNSLGCDSTITLDFTRLVSTTGTEIVSACNSYTWNGITYTSNNNTAQDTLVNSAGCDSIVTLNLTILNSTSFTDVISSCNPITWLDGNTYSANNNTATYTLVNALGCDSIITLDFTLLQASSGTDVITSCSSITWIDGITYNQTTNNPVFTIPNNQGCDSVITLDFTLLEADTTVTRNYLTLTAQANNASYQWIDCDNGVITGETNASFTATLNGNYQVEATQNGCVDTSTCFAIMNVGVEDLEENENVKVYPNPTSSKLFIEAQNFKIIKIQILDNSGKVVKIITSNFDIVNVESLATGIYNMKLIGEKDTVIKKFIKQ